MVDRGDRGAEVLEAGTKMGVMAMEITQSTGVICAQIIEFRDSIGYSDINLWDIRLWKHFVNHGLETRQFRTGMGGVTDNITQSKRLWRWRRIRVSRGSLVFLCPLSSFSLLTRSGRNRRWFLLS